MDGAATMCKTYRHCIKCLVEIGNPVPRQRLSAIEAIHTIIVSLCSANNKYTFSAKNRRLTNKNRILFGFSLEFVLLNQIAVTAISIIVYRSRVNDLCFIIWVLLNVR